MGFELDQPSSGGIGGFELDQPGGFGSGTLARMSQVEGMSPEQAASKSRSDFIEGIKNAPAALKQTVLNAYKAEKDPVRAIRHIARSLPGLPKYYWENPDVLATDVAAAAFPGGGEVKAAEGLVEAAPEVERAAETAIPRPTKAEAGKKIQEPKEVGEEFPPTQIAPVLADIRKTLKTPEYGYDRVLHRNVSRALGNMDRILVKSTVTPEAEQALSEQLVTGGGVGARNIAKLRLETMAEGEGHNFVDLHNARQALKPALSAGGNQARMAEMMQEKLDDYIFNLPGGDKFKQGIEEYAKAAKLDEIEQIKERAGISAGSRFTTAGQAHALAVELKKIATNPKKLRLWTPEEQARIKRIAGRKDLSDRIFRTVGRLSVRGPASLGFDAIIGHILHGVIPGGPYGLMAAGEIARQLERRGMEKQIGEFEDLVAAGSEEKLSQLRGKLNTPQTDVVAHLQSKPATRQAIANWLKKGAPKAATRTLAVAIARELNTPQLVPRIENELNSLGN